jgi:hypothetical protein
MNNDMLTKWTAIVTNVAIVIGLAFVGLEFNANTKSVMAERLAGHEQSVIDVTMEIAQDPDLSDILYRAYSSPSSLSPVELDRYQNFLFVYHASFEQTLHDYEAGFLSVEKWEKIKTGIGFAFSSDLGFETVDIMLGSTLNDASWAYISESAKQARIFCQNPSNRCLSRFEAARRVADPD